MRIRFGYHVRKLDEATKAAKMGFDSIWVADHFLPWSHRFTSAAPDSIPMVLSVLPIILDRTKCIVGSSVICPLFRYHPVVIGQYFANLGHLFPSRVMLGVGTGEAINDVPLVGSWPSYEERRSRLIESVEIINKLFTSEEYFDYSGRYYRLKGVYLYLKPKSKIPIIISCQGPKSAELAGELGDGVIVGGGASPHKIENLIIPSFSRAAKRAGKDEKTLIKQVWITGGLTSDPQEAAQISKPALPWLNPGTLQEADPRKIDEIAREISTEEILRVYPFVSEADDLIDYFESYARAGINEIIYDDLSQFFQNYCLKYDKVETAWRKIFHYFREKK